MIFYVEQHNTVAPHSAFRGQTSDEMYFGRAAGVFERLEAQREESRRKRLEPGAFVCGMSGKWMITGGID